MSGAARRLGRIQTVQDQVAGLDLAHGLTPLRLTLADLRGAQGVMRRGAAGFRALVSRRPEFVYAEICGGLRSTAGCFSSRRVSWDGGACLTVWSRVVPGQCTEFLLVPELIRRLEAKRLEVKRWDRLFQRWDALGRPETFAAWGVDWRHDSQSWGQFTQHDWDIVWGLP